MWLGYRHTEVIFLPVIITTGEKDLKFLADSFSDQKMSMNDLK